MDPAQEVQDRVPEIPQLPADFHRNERDATRNTDQLRALGLHLLFI